jgi:hypothetical protein
MKSIGLIRRILSRIFIEVDLICWHYQTAQIRNKGPIKFDKTVIICDLMAMASTSKVEALFAAVLAQNQCKPIVILPSKSRVLEKIFKSCADVKFVYLDELENDQTRNMAKSIAEKHLSNKKTIAEILKLEIDGIRTGRNILSRVMRKHRIGHFDDSEFAQIEDIRKALIESVSAGKIAGEFIAKVQPDLAIFLEKGYTPAGEFYDACILNGVETIQWLSAPQSDHLLFKRYTLSNRSEHPFALGKDSWEKIRSTEWTISKDKMVLDRIASHYKSGAWYNRQQLQIGKKLINSQEVRRKLGVADGRKVAVIFAHILYDATFFYGDNIYSDYEEWLVETVRGAIANNELDWVVKVHPVNVWRSLMDGEPMEQLESRVLNLEFGQLPPHVKIMPADTDINTHSLFEAIDYGITVRGTVGMELPCYGIPVVTAGTGRYSGHGFTIDPISVREYQEVLAKLHKVKPLSQEQASCARQYAYGAFFLRPIRTESFRLNYDAKSYGVAALKYNVELNKEQISLWPDVSDLQRFADWALNSESSELMALEEMSLNGY